MKYVSAYLMCALSKEEVSAKDIEKVLSAAGIECDMEMAEKLVTAMAGKNLTEVISEGREKLKGFGGGGGAAPAAGAAAAAGGAAPAAAAVVEEEEEEEEMDFDLFG